MIEAAVALMVTPVVAQAPAWPRVPLPRPAAGPRPTELPPVARQVYDGVMSPFCPGLLLANCPSPQADSLRRAVARRAAAGESRAHLIADLVATYGDGIRAAPASRGFGLVAWLAPALVLVGGAAGVARWLTRTVRPAPAAPLSPLPGSEPDPPHDAARAELAALDALLRRG
jgi:cytochrome c-type biogenesis protein CcmH